MSSFSQTIAIAAAIAGLLVSSVATAAPAAKVLAPSGARAHSPTDGSSQLGSSTSTATLISVGLLVAFATIVLLTTGGNKAGGGSPASP